MLNAVKHPGRVGNSIFKTGSVLGLGVMLIAGLLWWSLPLSVKRSEDITRGEELIQRLEQYQQQNATLPDTDDWVVLKQIGFTVDEMERANPQYTRLDDAYQLAFASGFDGPCLMWNSRERKWREGFPAISNR